MITQATTKRDAEDIRKQAEQLLEGGNTIRKRSEAMLSKSGGDLARMSGIDIEKLVYEFQVHQIELELQNEELKRAHQELSVSRDDFARIYNLSPVAYLSLNEQGTIKKANRAAMQLLGCAIEAMTGKKLGKFIHPSDQDSYYYFLQDLVTEQVNQILNTRLVTPNNASRHAECHGMTLYSCSQDLCSHKNQFIYVELRGAVSNDYNGEVKICLAIQDVTEYKHTQETIFCLNEKLEQKILEQTSALMDSNLDLTRKIAELEHSRRQVREREAKLNAIFNASIEGIITVNASGIIQSTNAAVVTIFGYSDGELPGCSINKLMSTAHKHDLNGYLQTKVSGVIGQIREVEGLRKDGSLVPLDISLVEFSIDGADYFTGIVRDVSLRKQQEQQEKEHLNELAHVSRLCLIGEMGSGIAHEVNQPLTAIANYTQACLRFIDVEKPDLDKLSNILFKTHQQALKAGQIIHRMKDFASHRRLHRSDTDINALIRDAASLCARDLKKNNIKLKLELAKDLPEVAIDDVQIEQVLLNMIRNSLDALKARSPEIARQLSIQTRLNHGIEVRVKDNGLGIAEAQKEKILMPFFTTKSSGMGMGLSISRSIIDAHDGDLSFNSKLGAGTTFYFTLPINGDGK
jgi:PAS domain S-box-containing protein